MTEDLALGLYELDCRARTGNVRAAAVLREIHRLYHAAHEQPWVVLPMTDDECYQQGAVVDGVILREAAHVSDDPSIEA